MAKYTVFMSGSNQEFMLVGEYIIPLQLILTHLLTCIREQASTNVIGVPGSRYCSHRSLAQGHAHFNNELNRNMVFIVEMD